MVQQRRSWRERFGVFSPLFFYDLVRTARRNRHIPLRCLYAVFLLVVLSFLFAERFGSFDNLEGLFRDNSLPIKEQSQFANSFFSVFLVAQFTVVFLITPAYVAGSIAEEREHRTLDLLLTACLSDAEIVLGTLAARLANLGLLLLAGLPVVCMTQFLGGVDPNLVLLGFGVTAMTMLSLGSLSMLISVHARKVHTAIFTTYLIGFVFLALSAGIPPLNWGNPLAALGGIAAAPEGGDFEVLWITCIVLHGAATLFFCSLAVAQLRGVDPEPWASPVVQPRSQEPGEWGPSAVEREVQAVVSAGVVSPLLEPDFRRPFERPRPPVSEPPMLWKERHVEHPVGRFVGGCLFIVGIMAFFLFMGACLSDEKDHWTARTMTAAVACWVLASVPFYAAGSITKEREQRTLDTLLVTTLDRDEILYAKWLGSMIPTRWGWVFLGLILASAAAFGTFHAACLPLLAAACFIYMAFLACMGLWFSTISTTTLRANLLTTLATLAIGGVSWAVTIETGADSWLQRFYTYGLTPPRTLATLAFGYDELTRDPNALKNVHAALLGLLCYAAATVVLWQLTRSRFRKQTGEDE